MSDYDVIIVGGGLTGALAAKELCERGLRTLLVERGPAPRPCPQTLEPEGLVLDDYQVQRTCYAFSRSTAHQFVNDRRHPYRLLDDALPFHWIRGHLLGGRSLSWARQCYRLSDLDFEANATDGHGVDWPIRYADIEPWYAHVESIMGLSGQAEGLPQLPDGVFLPPLALNSIEQHLRRRIREHFGRSLTVARVAVRTDGHKVACPDCGTMHADVAPFFSSLNGLLPAASATGLLTVLTNSVVTSVLHDESTGLATGVRVVDADSRRRRDFPAPLVFLCASALATTQIMLNSVSSRHPRGIGNASGALGRYLMDHHGRAGAVATFPAHIAPGSDTASANLGFYIARYRNLHNERGGAFLRGFGVKGTSSRDEDGRWHVRLSAVGETLPCADNRVCLDPHEVDAWGVPLLRIRMAFGENERLMRNDMTESLAEMLVHAGADTVETFDEPSVPGDAIHEMGTARMGRDPKSSVLNAWNQCHDVPNLFVTDGACMTSSAVQNPSLTYMALTARACHFAADKFHGSKRDVA